MGSVGKKLAAVLAAGLVLAGLARRGRRSEGPGWRNPPGSGVREPRRPLQPTGSAAAAADPTAD